MVEQSVEKFIQIIAKKAGDAVLKRLGIDRAHYYKSEHPGDVVTKADLLADRIITSAIRKRYPDHGIISEESGSHEPDAEYCWMIDPIDGTLNFTSGIPFFGVMIGLCRNNIPELAAVYLPATKEMFFAHKSKGAYLTGKRVVCSENTDWTRSTGAGPSGLRLRGAKFIQNLSERASAENITFTAFGSLAVNACYTAAGRRDWVVAVGGGVHDYASTSLILMESGCRVTDTKGKPWKNGQFEIVAANPTLHKQLLKLTKNV